MRLEQTVVALRDHALTLRCTGLLAARWTIDVPELEAKMLLGRHLADDLDGATRIAQRLAALGVDIDLRQSDDFALFEELVVASHAPGTLEKLTLMYEGLKPILLRALDQHLTMSTPIADEPTTILLQELRNTLATQLRAVSGLRTVLCEQFGDSWKREANALELRPKSARVPDLSCPAYPARDPRLSGGAPPPKLTPEASRDTLLHLVLHTNLTDLEVPTIETCSRAILEFYQDMPWEFVVDMALQAHDEARHAELFYNRLQAMGWKLGEYTISQRVWEMGAGQPLGLRLGIHQRIGEQQGVDAALWLAKMFDEAGDAASAELFEFVAQDEVRHVAYGSKWMRYLAGSEEELRRLHDEAIARRREFGRSREAAPLGFPPCREAYLRGGYGESELQAVESSYRVYGSVFPELS